MSYIHKLHKRLLKAWYSQLGRYDWISIFLYPLSYLVEKIARLRNKLYHNQTVKIPNCYVIVVGNITVGGTGKTPVVLAVANFLIAKGYKVGIVSRGYGCKTKKFPYVLSANSLAAETGDEPWLLYNKLKVPVVIDPDRKAACEHIISNYKVNAIISDDGLQHYNMHRDFEIVVIDGKLGFGNGLCIPSGPLREPISRLLTVNAVCINGLNCNHNFSKAITKYNFQIHPLAPIRLIDGTSGLQPTKIHAVAAIGNPKKFFTILNNLGFTVIPHTFPDHYLYSAEDIEFNDDLAVIMTEKDAVKCLEFAKNNHWMLPIEAKLPQQFLANLLKQMPQDI